MRLLNNSFIFFALFAISCNGSSQTGFKSDVAIAFYNVENFFDTLDNPHKIDNDFTPEGKYHYGQRVYEQKLHNIATVVQSMDNGKSPAIIGLAEVENATVLRDLARQPELRRSAYKYVWYDGPDIRGINVALMYNPDYFHMLGSQPLNVDLSSIQKRSLTRDVLYVRGVLAGDTVHILVNHWPSRRGGVAKSNPKRAIAARVNKAVVDGILEQNPNARIIVMGDFNDNPDDPSLTKVLQSSGKVPASRSHKLYNPFAKLYSDGLGTEVYRHVWNLFDQIIISSGMLQTDSKLKFESANIYKPKFIQETYKGHVGEPHRSFKGSHWIKGYSDHYPVVIYCTAN